MTLELQAHQPGHGWRTVKTTRTRKGGAYSTRYRFNSGGGRFTFRLRSAAQRQLSVRTWHEQGREDRSWVERAILAFVLCACVVLPASAHAGSYDVYSCKFGSSFYGNNAGPAVATAGGNAALVTTGHHVLEPRRRACGRATAQRAVLAGIVGGIPAFLPPTNTRITDYAVTLRQLYTAAGLNSDPNTPYVMSTFGPYAFALAGNYDAGVIAYVTQDQHYWGAAGPIDKTVTLSKADSPHSSGVQGTARRWWSRPAAGRGAPPCAAWAPVTWPRLQLLGSKVTIEDTVPPVMSGVQAGTGLLAPGVRSGDEPVTFSATDNSGIRRAEIVDVTDAANPAVVASEDYGSGPNTDAGTRCDYTRPRPCPTSRTRRSPLRHRSRAIGRCCCA